MPTPQGLFCNVSDGVAAINELFYSVDAELVGEGLLLAGRSVGKQGNASAGSGACALHHGLSQNR